MNKLIPTLALTLLTTTASAADYTLPNTGDYFQLQQKDHPWTVLCKTGDAQPCKVPAGDRYVLKNLSQRTNDDVSVPSASQGNAQAPAPQMNVTRASNVCLFDRSDLGIRNEICVASCPANKMVIGVTECYAARLGSLVVDPAVSVTSTDQTVACTINQAGAFQIVVELSCL